MNFQGTPEQLAERELAQLQTQKRNIEDNIAHCERQVTLYTTQKTSFETRLSALETKISELT